MCPELKKEKHFLQKEQKYNDKNQITLNFIIFISKTIIVNIDIDIKVP